MTKQEFFYTLKKHLRGVPKQEVKEIMYDYNEHFLLAKKEGREEEEIIAALGNPIDIAEEIKTNYEFNKENDSYKNKHIFKTIMVITGLVFFNLIFILGPVIGIIATLIALFTSGLAISLSGIGVIIAPLLSAYFQNIPNPIVGTFLGLMLISFGILWTSVFMYLLKQFYLVLLKYVTFNLQIILNRRNEK